MIGWSDKNCRLRKSRVMLLLQDLLEILSKRLSPRVYHSAALARGSSHLSIHRFLLRLYGMDCVVYGWQQTLNIG
jgi:hypothetical protein